MTTVTTTADFGLWVRDAERGESVVYARSPEPRDDMLRAARTAADLGLVSLVQRREAPGVLAYIAQRTFAKHEDRQRAPRLCGCGREAHPTWKSGLCRVCTIAARAEKAFTKETAA